MSRSKKNNLGFNKFLIGFVLIILTINQLHYFISNVWFDVKYFLINILLQFAK